MGNFFFSEGRMTLPPWRTLAIAAGAVVALTLLGIGAWMWNSSQQQRATSAYAEMLMKHRASAGPQATPAVREAAMRDLERVLAEHPTNAMAPQTAYLLGNLRFESGHFDRARAAYQLTAARTAGGTIATLARAGTGYAWEAERKLPEATQAFEAALAGLKPGAFYYEEILTDLARVQEQSGKKDAAIATYRRMLKDLPLSARAPEVRTKLGSLGATP
jgi:tetratricopeptide (TPR) repeat protein